MTEAEDRLLYALMCMCAQYIEEDGELDHMCMSAGEEAVELLVEYGLVSPANRGGTWIEAGKALLWSR